MAEATHNLYLRIPLSLMPRLRAHAARRDTFMNTVIIEMLDRHLDEGTPGESVPAKIRERSET